MSNEARYYCLWCGTPVKHRGDTCSIEHYENICHALSVGEPYLKDEDDPPNDLYRQPWSRKDDD